MANTQPPKGPRPTFKQYSNQTQNAGQNKKFSTNQTQTNNSRRNNIILWSGISIIVLLVALFVGYELKHGSTDIKKNSKSNDPDVTDTNNPSKDTQNANKDTTAAEDTEDATNGNAIVKGTNNVGANLDYNKNLSDKNQALQLTNVTYARLATDSSSGFMFIIPRQDNVITVSSDSTFDKYAQPQNQSWGKQVYTGELYGFASYKKNGIWHRIDSIKPLPSIESKYEKYGGKTAELIQKDIDTNASKLDSVNTGGSLSDLSFDATPQMANYNKDSDTPKAVKVYNEALENQASKITKPADFYFMDNLKIRVNKEGYLSVPKEQRYRIADDYYVMPSKKAVQTVIDASQTNAQYLVNTWTQRVAHTIYVKGKLVIIDGIAYNLKDVVLDLYTDDNTDATVEKFSQANINTDQYGHTISMKSTH